MLPIACPSADGWSERSRRLHLAGDVAGLVEGYAYVADSLLLFF